MRCMIPKRVKGIALGVLPLLFDHDIEATLFFIARSQLA